MNSKQDYINRLEKGRACLNTKKLEEAEQIALYLFENYPKMPPTLFFLGQVAMERRRFVAAEDFYSQAIKLAPKEAGIRIAHAKALAALGRRVDSMKSLDKSVSLQPNDPKILHKCAMSFNQLSEYERALELWTTALDHVTDDPIILHNIAAVHRTLGNLSEAEKFANKAIVINPNIASAIYLRSDVRKVTQDDNHIAHLEEHLSNTEFPAATKHQYLQALAKEYEDIGDYKKSFETLKISTLVRRDGIDYDVKDDITLMSDMAKHYSAKFFKTKREGFIGGKTPIFILGLPRAGSTLLERILGGHPDVTSMGERIDFDRSLRVQIREAHPGLNIEKEDFVTTSTAVDFRKLGATYMKRTAPYAGDTSHCLDKMPVNYLYSGLILTALPNAKIIHIRRSPMDACYAMLKMSFNRAYPFSYDLDELAYYYIAHHTLMQHWHEVLGEQMFEVNYKDLVADTQGTVRKLTDGCGLEWNPDILDYEKNKGASTTASAAQIRQPIYSSSVEKWRHYEAQLAPVRARLEDAGINVGDSGN